MHLNHMHTQLGGAFEVESAIVDEATFFGWALGDFEGEAIDRFLGLAKSDETGTDEQAEDFTQAEGLDAIEVEVGGFVVDGAHQIVAGVRQRTGQFEDRRVGLRERQHVVFEVFDGEGAGSIENGAVEIFVKADLAAFKGRDDHVMAVVEFGFVETEMIEGLLALGVVPGVGEQHAADIPEECGDFGQRGLRSLRAECGIILKLLTAKGAKFWQRSLNDPEIEGPG